MNLTCIHVQDLQRNSSNMTQWTQLDWVNRGFVTAVSLIFFASILGNSFVSVAVVRYCQTLNARNLLILNLSCSDMLFTLVAVPIGSYILLYDEWWFGTFLCHAVPSLENVSVSITSLTLVMIAVDSFLKTVFPTKTTVLGLRMGTIVALMWFLAVGGSLPMFITQSVTNFNGRLCENICWDTWNPEHRRKYKIIMMFLQFGVPIVIITSCYLVVVLRIRQLGSLTSSGCSYSVRQKRQRGTRLVVGMMVAFVGSFGMEISMNIFREFGVMPELVRRQEKFFSVLSHVIGMTATIWNPVLYAFLNKNLQDIFLRMARCQGPGSQNDSKPGDIALNSTNRAEILRLTEEKPSRGNRRVADDSLKNSGNNSLLSNEKQL